MNPSERVTAELPDQPTTRLRSAGRQRLQGARRAPVAAAVAGALISGVAMYTVGARTEQVDAFTDPGVVAIESVAPATGAGSATALQPAAPAPAVVQRVSHRRTATAAPQPRRTVVRQTRDDDGVVSAQDDRQKRTWSKSALIIGGTAASGAGVGAIVDGKKGALIGAAIGGGAASIYEATRRR
jgi:hypothetical protein